MTRIGVAAGSSSLASVLRALVAVGLLAGPISATTEQDLTDCQRCEASCTPAELRDSVEPKIAGCTRILDDPEVEGRARSIAFQRRAHAWAAKGDNKRAIADYDEAIKFDPTIASAYAYRASAWFDEGDSDRALSDYSEAIRLAPKDSASYAWRGYTQFARGDFPKSAADVQRSIELAGKITYAYPILFLYLARSRMGENGAADLAKDADRTQVKGWPYPAVDLFLGRRSADELLAAASNANERCVAQFFVGEWYILHDDRAAAERVLHTAADSCPTPFLRRQALAELERSKAPKRSKPKGSKSSKS